MRIAMISSGSSIHVKKIANALAERGHEIVLFTLPNHSKLLADFDKRISVVKLPVKGKLGYYLNAPFIRKSLFNNPVDIVNSHYASGYGTLARLVGKHPLVLAVFGSDVFDFPFRSNFNKSLMLKNLESADVITSTSQAMASKLKEFYHSDKRVYITPFGVDRSIFVPYEVEKDDCFEIGIIKKIEHIYGHEFLLRAFKKLREQYGVSQSRLVIYGRGSAEDDLKQLASSLGLDESVEFKGFVPNEEIPSVLSHMDVMCLPSIVDESFGVAAVEAMACGVIVIATDAVGFKEVIDDGVTGFIIPKKDDDSLAETLYKVYKMSKEERRLLGNNGVVRVKENYDYQRNMDVYENVLIDAIKVE